MNITLGSLSSQDIHSLQELDLLPEDFEPGDVQPSDKTAVQAPATPQQQEQAVTRTEWSGRIGGLSWFEEMLDGSRLGRTQNSRRGIGISSDGSTSVEWEISEYYDDGTEQATPPGVSKRKIGDVGEDDEVEMAE